MIRKVKSGYAVISHRTGKRLGTYKTRAAAQAAIRRHKHFSKAKKKR